MHPSPRASVCKIGLTQVWDPFAIAMLMKLGFRVLYTLFKRIWDQDRATASRCKKLAKRTAGFGSVGLGMDIWPSVLDSIFRQGMGQAIGPTRGLLDRPPPPPRFPTNSVA